VIGEGGGGDRGEIGGGAVIGEKRSALTTSPSVVISGHQWSSVVIRGHQRRLTPLTVRCLDLLVISIGHQWSSVVISGGSLHSLSDASTSL
jgi:hypothetical protein